MLENVPSTAFSFCFEVGRVRAVHIILLGRHFGSALLPVCRSCDSGCKLGKQGFYRRLFNPDMGCMQPGTEKKEASGNGIDKKDIGQQRKTQQKSDQH